MASHNTVFFYIQVGKIVMDYKSSLKGLQAETTEYKEAMSQVSKNLSKRQNDSDMYHIVWQETV